MVEIFGPESSGKTSLALHILAECQKQGGQVAFVDVEHALDPKYASVLGVDMDKVLMSQPDSAEQALEVVEALVRSGEVDVVVVDSVAALAPRAELNGEFGDALVGVVARLMSSAMRKLTHTVSETNCMVLFINQLRDKIGGFGYGPTETTTGGRALRYYCSVRLDIRRIGAVKNGEEIIGNKTKIKVVKNKFSAPHKEIEADIIYGEGFSRESDLLDLAVSKGVIVKKGAWFYYSDKSIGQGRENARKSLKDLELYNEIKSKI
jgi:recombination protein RecA